jgi:Icc-related predicted phosphoesterase
MRILLTSDLHYKLRQYDWLIGNAAAYDAVVIAGDHIDGALPVPSEVQIAALSATLAAVAKESRVMVCSGNHDLNDRNGAGEMTANWLAPLRSAALAVDGDTVEVGDTLFTVCPWWDGPAAQAGVADLLDAAAAQRQGRRWVWVYHAPPVGVLSWTGKRHFGDEFLSAQVQRHVPSAVLCGHIHEAPFKNGGGWSERVGDTWLFNAGRQIGDIPTRVEIDFAGGVARWFSMEGVEEQPLLQ